ncbi:MAG: citrate/2-methylcitrate synthase, partial [Saccharofermentanaceae bacterium]
MAAVNSFSRITPEIEKLSQNCMEARIDPELYTQLNVNRGLRDINGKGVLTGLTEISEIVSSKMVDGVSVPCEGELYYRGINVIDLVNGFTNDNRFGFEETTYLLLFGKLPNKTELADFEKILSGYRNLPKNFVRDVIMKKPSDDLMN